MFTLKSRCKWMTSHTGVLWVLWVIDCDLYERLCGKNTPSLLEGRETCLYLNGGCNVFCNIRRISFQPDGAESGTQLCTLNGQKRARWSGPCGGVAFVIRPSITETECSVRLQRGPGAPLCCSPQQNSYRRFPSFSTSAYLIWNHAFPNQPFRLCWQQ